jgi:mycoredoxin
MIRMYSTNWCGDCRVTKRVLDSRGVVFEEINIENDELAAQYVMQVNGGKRSVPTLEFAGDAISLSNFSRARLDAWLEKHGLYSVPQAENQSSVG